MGSYILVFELVMNNRHREFVHCMSELNEVKTSIHLEQSPYSTLVVAICSNISSDSHNPRVHPQSTMVNFLILFVYKYFISKIILEQLLYFVIGTIMEVVAIKSSSNIEDIEFYK